jgi:prepilin-type N-terminal cleavage/methylation domain-containing protein
MLTRRNTDDEGLTLIELVVTIAIMSIIMASLIGMVFLYMRTSNDASTKMNESTDQQFASAFWQQDVSSLGVRGTPGGVGNPIPTSQSVWTFSTPGTAPSSLPGLCAGQTNTIAAFAWNDYQNIPTASPSTAWNGSLNAAVYYTKTVTNSNGKQQLQLWRMRCGDQGSNNALARFLDPNSTPSVACYDSSGAGTPCSSTSPLPATIRLTMTVRDLSKADHAPTGYTTILTADRRQG